MFYSYRDHEYRAHRRYKDRLSRDIIVRHEVRLPDGSTVEAPFPRRFIADRETFVEWVNLRLLPLYEVDGYRYEPVRITPWTSVVAARYQHVVRAPDGSIAEFPHPATSLVPRDLFVEWMRWGRPTADALGRRVLSLGLFRRLDRLAQKHGIGREQHEVLAVFSRLASGRG